MNVRYACSFGANVRGALFGQRVQFLLGVGARLPLLKSISDLGVFSPERFGVGIRHFGFGRSADRGFPMHFGVFRGPSILPFIVKRRIGVQTGFPLNAFRSSAFFIFCSRAGLPAVASARAVVVVTVAILAQGTILGANATRRPFFIPSPEWRFSLRRGACGAQSISRQTLPGCRARRFAKDKADRIAARLKKMDAHAFV
jgi:hypothetical protein